MRIKYIKDAPRGKAGSTDKVTDFEANILILIGLAELDNTIYFDEQSQFTLVTESRSLVNPNQILEPTKPTKPTEPIEPTEPTKPKPKTKSKAKATTKTDNG